MIKWIRGLVSPRTRQDPPTESGQPGAKTKQEEDRRVEPASSPLRDPAPTAARPSFFSGILHWRSQSTSPTARDSVVKERPETARHPADVPVPSIRDLLSQATSSSNPVEYIRSSHGDDVSVVIDQIDDWLSHDHGDELWAKSFLLLPSLCYASSRLPTALHLSGVEFDAQRDPVACGAYTDVYQGLFFERLVAVKVAVKRARIAGGPTDRETFSKRLAAEAVAWRHLKHPNIVPFLGIVQDQKTPFAIIHTVTPWISQGTLLSYIKSSSYDASKQRIQLLSEVAQALAYLHSLSIVHGDLKFTNVLVDADGHAKVMDFGLSTIIGPSFAGESAASGNSARWMGPEFVADLDTDETPRPTAKSDVFSFGRLIYAVSTKREPLQHMRSDVAVVLFLQSGRQPPRPTAEHCAGVPMSDALWQLALDCWRGTPEERPDMSEVVHRLQPLETP